MLKKIILVTIGVVILTGVEALYAQEERDRPEPRSGQRARGEQLRGQQADGEAQAKYPMAVLRRLQQELKQTERQQEAAKKAIAQQQKRHQEVTRKAKALRKKIQQERQRIKRQQGAIQQDTPWDRGDIKPQQLRRDQNLPMPQVFGQWLDNLTKAYRENDRQKMGQLIRRMQQRKQQMQKARFPLVPPRQGPQPRGIGRQGQDINPWSGKAPQLRDIGRRGQGRGAVDEQAPPPRGIGRRGQNRDSMVGQAPPPRGLGSRPGRDFPRQSESEPTEQDLWPDLWPDIE